MYGKGIIGLALTLLLLAACRTEQNTNQSTSNGLAPGQPLLESSAAAPEWANNINIYEVNVRQYTPEGTFAAFAEHLPRLKNLGVDLLWFMPIYPISEARRKGTLGSYYAIADYTAVNPNFGTLEDFRRLVEAIHAQNMRVILDWVPNHTGWDHHWITEHPEWYTKSPDGQITDPLDAQGKSMNWTDVADLNFDNPDMRRAMIGEMKWWLDSAGIDGFRVDVAWATPVDFWEQAIPELRASKPDLFLLAEAEQPSLRNRELFAATYAWTLHHLMNDIAAGEVSPDTVRAWFAADRDSFSRGFNMQFITNHDENSWAGTEFERMGEAVDAMAVFYATFDGMPLIYSGQEASFNRRLQFFEKDSISWADTTRYGFYRTLLDLKQRNQALWNGAAGGRPVFLDLGDPQKVLAYYRAHGEDAVVVILNLSNEPQTVTLDDDQLAGNFTNVFSNSTTALARGTQLPLGPWKYLVLER